MSVSSLNLASFGVIFKSTPRGTIEALSDRLCLGFDSAPLLIFIDLAQRYAEKNFAYMFGPNWMCKYSVRHMLQFKVSQFIDCATSSCSKKWKIHQSLCHFVLLLVKGDKSLSAIKFMTWRLHKKNAFMSLLVLSLSDKEGRVKAFLPREAVKSFSRGALLHDMLQFIIPFSLLSPLQLGPEKHERA